MAISNTSILIKRSSSTATPTLKAGELGYSYLSNTFFIGNSTGTGVVNVGGLLYTQTIDQATNANTGSTLVKRASDGSFFGQLFGNANTATALQTGRTVGIIAGDANANSVTFDGTKDINLSVVLSTMTNLTAGQYGSTTAVPVITVAANGRVTNVSTQAISTSTYVANSSVSTALAGGQTLTFLNNNGITTQVSANGSGANVIFSTDNTVLRSNTTTNVGPVQTISTDLTIAGNLIVTGTQTFVNTSTIVTNDSLIKLAANNTTADIVDIGFYGTSNINPSAAGSNVFHGIIREGSGGTNAGDFYVFKNLVTDPTGNTVNYAALTQANLRANIISSNVTTVNLSVSNTANITTLGVSGVSNLASLGATTANIAGLTVTNTTVTNTANIVTLGVSGVANLASLGATTANIAGLTVTNTTVTNTANISTLGVSGVANLASLGVTTANIAGLTVTNTTVSGTANVATLGVSGVSNLASLGATTANIAGLTVTNTTVTSTANISTLGVSGVANLSSLGATTANITGATISTLYLTNALGVPQGGTGAGTFTANGIIFGNGTGALLSTAAAGSADQTWSNQILTVTNTGAPVWTTTMDGGTF